jgi:hypothetical protein
MSLKNIFLLIIISFTGFIGLSAQETVWNIPKDANEKTAPFLFNDSTRAAGENLFILNCKSCHGEPGKGNFNKQLIPVPKDPASPEYQKHTDGALYFIITTGKVVMPSFQNTLTNNQRWDVISYIRSFNKDYVQAAVKNAGSAEITGTIALEISYDVKLKSIIANIIDTAKGKKIPVGNANLKLFVKRTFGNLPVGEGTSNALGKVIIPFPNDIAGDTIGNIKLIAIAGTGGSQIISEKTEKIGTVVKPTNLLDQRAMWNVRSKAPLWLIISYFCAGIAVICTVLFVFMQLKKIKTLNQVNNNDHE